jgi:hypothetical protein
VRFNYVFITLLLIAATCAFFVPQEKSGRIRGQADVLFAPVTVPLRQVAAAISRRLGKGREMPLVDGAGPGKSPADAKAEIDQLLGKVANLTMQLEAMQRINAGRDLVGDARKYSMPFKVIGSSDSWMHNSFSLAGSSRDGLEAGLPVVHRDSVVGKITAVGSGGAQVRLITDPGFCINGAFFRIEGERLTAIKTDPPLVEGKGNGLMSISNLPKEQTDRVKVGDWVVLNDNEDWPPIINGYFLGRVEEIRGQPKSPLIWMELIVRPRVGLSALREVMVVMPHPTAGNAPAPPAKAAAKVSRPAAPVHTGTKGQSGKSRK